MSLRDLRSRLAFSLRRLRNRARLTQESAASAAGLHLRHYQKLEAGEVNVTLRTLDQLCTAFSVDVRELFGRK